MHDSADGSSKRRTNLPLSKSAILVSLATLCAAYGIAITSFGPLAKAIAFAALAAAYIAASWLLRANAENESAGNEAAENPGARAVQALEMLDEACSVFAGALGVADAFRIFASRMAILSPAGSVTLFLLDEARNNLKAVHVAGAGPIIGSTVIPGQGSVGLAYETGKIVDDRLNSVALPLFNDEHAFGVLELAGFDGAGTSEIYDHVASLCSRMILPAITKDVAQDNALVDATTDFPNERALRIVLENQTAEAQRERGNRALTVVAIDIRKFEELNQAFGHAAGDRVLRFAAATIKDSLRAMDFIARSRDDEFLIVLPTADSGTSREIVERIHESFRGHKIAINDTQAREVDLNIGSAVFGPDGETPQQLISMARLRKQESKGSKGAKVISFPQEPSGLIN